MNDPALLVAKTARGDEAAFRLLYEQEAPRLLGILLMILRDRAEAEDVLQQVFLDAWRQARRYDPERAGVATWLRQMARSRALDALRRSRRNRPASDEESGAEGPEPALVERLDVRAALGCLQPAERRCLELAYYGGYSQSQIAELVGLPLGTVKTATRRAIQRLRSVLGEGGGAVDGAASDR